MVRTKQTARKAAGGRGRPLPPVTHTPPLVEDGLLHTRCREDCTLSRILCRALRQMGRRPCPFYSVQTMPGQGNCWARVVLPHPNSAHPHTIVVYGANEEEAYLKAVTTAITFLSPEEDAGHSDLRYLPTQEMDDEWVRRHDMLKARNDTRPYAACMGFASEVHRMYDRAEGRSRFYFHRHAEARARVEELEGQVAQLQQRLAAYEPPPAEQDPQDRESSEPMEMEEEGEGSVPTGRSAT
ncbi:hypothetical protein U9M48_031435 [Paspalum notatum var. saurae]|uniref:Uncharacterized protein n=1 Tax=Paspalum notatum var. saurae TaxID=547442 RepID=A0AAQ3U376_PASNO